jgi:hypothetical protein
VRILTILLIVVAWVSACTMPETTVRSGSAPPPSLIVKGAPTGSTLFIDGLAMGPATQFDGNPNVLAVLAGVHKVEVRSGTSVVYSGKAFVSSGETHIVRIVGGAVQ